MWDVLRRAVATPSAADCAASTPNVLMVFSIADGPGFDVPLVTFGCNAKVAVVAGTVRSIDSPFASTLLADAGSYAERGSVPDLYGHTISSATAALHGRYTLRSNGQQVDPDLPVGTILLQYPPAGSASLGTEIDVVTVVHASPACRLSDLAMNYYGGGAATGNDFGSIRVRDVSAHACQLTGSVRLAGVDQNDLTVTQSVTFQVVPDLVLTPRAALVPPGQRPGPGEVTALISLVAGYRDDPTGTSPDGLCGAAQVIPAAWHLTFSDGTRDVANNSVDTGYPAFSRLITCRGRLGTAEPISAG